MDVIRKHPNRYRQVIFAEKFKDKYGELVEFIKAQCPQYLIGKADNLKIIHLVEDLLPHRLASAFEYRKLRFEYEIRDLSDEQKIRKIHEVFGDNYACVLKSKKFAYLVDWLDKRFPQLKHNSIATKIFWLVHGIEDFPRCQVCRRQVRKDVRSAVLGYTLNQENNERVFCSLKCSNNDEHVKELKIETSIRNNGTPYGVQSDKVKEEIKATNRDRYGYDCVLKSAEIQQEITKTFQRLYGVNRFTQTDQYKKLFEDKDWVAQTTAKKRRTMHKNNSFNVSKPEDEVYAALIEIFGECDIVRQYTESRYPFLCDFYVRSIDAFIECNFHWTHGPHAFDSANPKDLEIVSRWKEKDTPFYIRAIHNWTVADVNKVNVAKQNGIKLLAFYRKSDAIDWVKSFPVGVQ